VKQKLPIIEGNKRIILLGKTRTGKSTMARMLLKMKAAEGWWIIIVDPKKDWMLRDGGRTVIPYGELDLKGDRPFRGSVDNPIQSNVFIPEAKVIIYEPTSWDEFLDTMVDAAMTHKFVIFYFDEIRQLATSNKAPQKFIVLYTQGAAAMCGAWAGNQRPFGIPTDMKDQAEIWIVFTLIDADDRMDIGKRYMPKNKYTVWFMLNMLPYYYFLYYDDRMPGPIILPPLDIPGLKPERGISYIEQYRREAGGSNIQGR